MIPLALYSSKEIFQAIGFGLVTAAILGLAAVGLSLQVGVTNFVNFAYGDVMSLGAYLTYEFNTRGLPLPIAALVGALVLGLVMVITNRVVFEPFIRARTRLIIMLIVTFGLSFIIQNLIVLIWGAGAYRYRLEVGNAQHIGPFLWTATDMWIMVLAVTFLFALHLVLKYTKFGKSLRATSNNADLASACGINTWNIVNWTWAVSGFMAGLAGVALVAEVNTLGPVVGFNELFLVFGAIVLGGVGRPYGAMLGALIIGLTTGIAGMFVPGGYETAIAFVLMAAVLLLRPQGLFASRGRA